MQSPSQRALVTALVLLASSLGLRAQSIDQSKGRDPNVDYSSLALFGPWDDRNYDLDREDVALLAPAAKEFAQSEAIPAFYRVELRREFIFAHSGPVMYPRSGLPSFFNKYRGYLVEGRFFRAASRQADRWQVDLDSSSWDDTEYVAEFLSGEVRVTSPNGAAESAIAVNPVDPELIIAGTNGPSGGQNMHFSSDGGESWTNAGSLVGSCCDPTVGWSSDGTIAYTSTLQIPELFFYRSTDDGQTWIDQVQVDDGGGFVDKQYLHVDLSASSAHLDNLYHTWHESNVLHFSRSIDLGLSWSTPITLSGSGQAGIGSDITTDTAGNVYFFWPAFSAKKIFVRKSTDGGANFQAAVEVGDTEDGFDFAIPVMETRRVFIYNSADADRTGGEFDGRVYVAWTDATAPESSTNNNHARIRVAFSDDSGASWNVSTPHETADEETVDRFHQWLAVAGDGSVHLIFYDTRRDLPDRNQVDIFRTVSNDGGVSWSPPQLTTSVQSPNPTDGFEWGDYNGLDAVGQDLISIFTDNRDELGGDPLSLDVYSTGFMAGLFADNFESGDTSAWSTVVGDVTAWSASVP